MLYLDTEMTFTLLQISTLYCRKTSEHGSNPYGWKKRIEFIKKLIKRLWMMKSKVFPP